LHAPLLSGLPTEQIAQEITRVVYGPRAARACIAASGRRRSVVIVIAVVVATVIVSVIAAIVIVSQGHSGRKAG
jgi:hypothetical protein|tara:strand:- start:1756 stop:1977 length:222 start_codon:yes stop_codon:yes gene_type:complete